jgi:hypothetical protein
VPTLRGEGRGGSGRFWYARGMEHHLPPQPEPSPEEVRTARQELHHLVDLLPDALALALWRLVRAWIAPWHKDEGS